MMKRGMAAVLGLLLLVQGCAPKKSDHVQLTMWLVGSEAQARTINRLAQTFTQRTGVTVRCEAISWGEAHSKYLTAVAGGVEPDIGTMGLTWGVEFGRLGALVDLKPMFPEGVAAMQKQTFPGLWESVESGGTVYGVPFDVSVQLLYHRTDLIPLAPATWDDLTKLLAKMKADKQRMIFDWGNLSWVGYSSFLWQAGGDFYNASRTEATLDTPEAEKALKFFRDLYLEHDVPKTSVPVEQGLRTGEFPLVISGNWKIVSLQTGAPEIAGKWAVAPLPKGPSGKRTAFLGGRTASIFAKSKHKAEAWKFLEFLFEPEVHKALYEDGLKTYDAYLPPNMASWDALPMEPAMKAVLLQQTKEAKGPPAVIGWTENTHVLEEAIQGVILKGEDPEKALERVDQAMTRNIK